MMQTSATKMFIFFNISLFYNMYQLEIILLIQTDLELKALVWFVDCKKNAFLYSISICFELHVHVIYWQTPSYTCQILSAVMAGLVFDGYMFISILVNTPHLWGVPLRLLLEVWVLMQKKKKSCCSM